MAPVPTMESQPGRETQGPEGPPAKVTSEHVRRNFNGISSVLYYTRAAHFLGLWKSERILVSRFLPDKKTPLLEAGCGAGRVSFALWKLGYRRLSAFDFASELLDQAQSLAASQGAGSIAFRCADATTIERSQWGLGANEGFGGALFMFNGLMQIPGRRNRRSALLRIRELCSPGAPLIFTTHDRDRSSEDAGYWEAEARRWAEGRQDRRLREFGDRQFEDESGPVFIHIPDRAEILGDLAATGWTHETDTMRSELARETDAVTEFSDNCRFWVARRDARDPIAIGVPGAA